MIRSKKIGLRLSGRRINGSAKVGESRRDVLPINRKFFAQANNWICLDLKHVSPDIRAAHEWIPAGYHVVKPDGNQLLRKRNGKFRFIACGLDTEFILDGSWQMIAFPTGCDFVENRLFAKSG